MKPNVGKADRIGRFVLGLVMLAPLVFATGNWRWFGLIGLVLIATSLVQWCPLYTLLGISSCKLEQRK